MQIRSEGVRETVSLFLSFRTIRRVAGGEREKPSSNPRGGSPLIFPYGVAWKKKEKEKRKTVANYARTCTCIPGPVGETLMLKLRHYALIPERHRQWRHVRIHAENSVSACHPSTSSRFVSCYIYINHGTKPNRSGLVWRNFGLWTISLWSLLVA